ncbi:MAG: hypothetical protein PF487_13465 [Bacteroidales bacterium]|nr:hypothetical protein [Bacteroidales bacterium]
MINKSYEYGYDYDMMKRLNYNDLLYILVNKEIEKIQEYFRKKEHNRNEDNGYDVKEVNEDTINMIHKRH